MTNKNSEPPATPLTTTPSVSLSEKTATLLECIDEKGGGFRFEINEDKTVTVLLFKPKNMDEVTFQRKMMQMERAFNWITKMTVRRTVV